MRPLVFLAFAACVLAGGSEDARAFPHVVQPGETLAQIAQRTYGEAKLETVLVGANALDVQGGSAIVSGMRIEIPAPGHHKVTEGETWAELSLSWLGDTKRARTAPCRGYRPSPGRRSYCRRS